MYISIAKDQNLQSNNLTVKYVSAAYYFSRSVQFEFQFFDKSRVNTLCFCNNMISVFNQTNPLAVGAHNKKI